EAVGQQPQRGIGVGGHAAAPRHPEGRHLRVLEGLPREEPEQRLLLGVRARKSSLDEVHAEAVERVRDAQLLVDRERHALALHAVTEGGVVEEDSPAHAVEGTWTMSSHSAYCGVRPQSVSSKTPWICRVMGPGSPIGMSSTSRTGVSSAAVPVRNSSSAFTSSPRAMSRSKTSKPRSRAIVITDLRLIPSRMLAVCGGV